MKTVGQKGEFEVRYFENGKQKIKLFQSRIEGAEFYFNHRVNQNITKLVLTGPEGEILKSYDTEDLPKFARIY